MSGTTKKHRIEKFLKPIPYIGPRTTWEISQYFQEYKGISLPNFILRVVLNDDYRIVNIPCLDYGRRRRIAKRYQEVHL